MDFVEKALEELRSDDSETRANAVSALGAHGDERARQPLEQTVLHDDGTYYSEGGFADRIESVASDAADALRSLCARLPLPPSELARLGELLRNEACSGSSVESLFLAMGKPAVPIVAEAAADRDPRVRLRAMLIRQKLDGKHLAPFATDDEEVRLAATQEDAYRPGWYLAIMGQLDREPSARVRRGMADFWIRQQRRLGRVETTDALRFLADADPEVRLLVAQFILDTSSLDRREGPTLKQLASEIIGIAPAVEPVAPPTRPQKTSDALPPSPVRALFDRKRAQSAEELAEAERKAAGSGKEPFDARQLRTLCDCGNASDAELRVGYFVSHPELRTIAEYARLLNELAPWADSS